jgi:hypothetical protein
MSDSKSPECPFCDREPGRALELDAEATDYVPVADKDTLYSRWEPLRLYLMDARKPDSRRHPCRPATRLGRAQRHELMALALLGAS